MRPRRTPPTRNFPVESEVKVLQSCFVLEFCACQLNVFCVGDAEGRLLLGKVEEGLVLGDIELGALEDGIEEVGFVDEGAELLGQ
jgi:hypothetical protein